MSQFYTLEEAAAKLNITTDQLRDLARKKEIRSLLDQGKLRFRAEDVDSRIEMMSASQDMTQDLDSPFTLDEPTSKPSSQPHQEETPLSLDIPEGDDFNISLDDVTPASGRGQSTQIAPKSNLPGGTQDSGDLFDSSAFDIADSSESAPSKGSGAGSGLPTDSPFEISEPNIDLGDATGDTAEISLLEAVNPESKELTLGDIDLEGTGSEGHPPLSLEGSSSDGGSSDFELSLDDGGDSGQEPPSTDLAPSSSESEFELTMSEEIGVSENVLEPSSDDFSIDSGDGPDSGSQVVEVDGSLEQDSLGSTAEFHAGDDIEESSDDESSSQVVEVPEEEEIAEVSMADDVEAVDAEDSAIIEGVSESPDEEMVASVGSMSVATAEAPWGALPAFLLIPTVVVLFVVSLLIFELMRNMWSYNKGTGFSSIILKPLTELFVELPKN